MSVSSFVCTVINSVSISVKSWIVPSERRRYFNIERNLFFQTIFLKADDKINSLISSLFVSPFPSQVCISDMTAVDLGLLSKVLVEHHQVGYGAGWYLDQIVIRESDETDGQYAFLCQQWLDSGVGDAQMERTLKLLGKVRSGMLTGKIYGKVPNHQSSFQLLF